MSVRLFVCAENYSKSTAQIRTKWVLRQGTDEWILVVIQNCVTDPVLPHIQHGQSMPSLQTKMHCPLLKEQAMLNYGFPLT